MLLPVLSQGQVPFMLVDEEITGAWDIENYSYTKNMPTKDAIPSGVFLKPDGSELYEVGYDDDSVHQYTLSTPHEVDSYSYDTTIKEVRNEFGLAEDMFFDQQGNKYYEFANDSLWQYSLTSWDMTTLSYVRGRENRDIYMRGFFISSDGINLYTVNSNYDSIWHFTLTEPWDVNSDNYQGGIETEYVSPLSVFFNTNGSKMFVVDYDSIYQYSLSTYWDISTANFDNKAIPTQDDQSRDIFFNWDGTRLYEIGRDQDSIYQYNLQGY